MARSASAASLLPSEVTSLAVPTETLHISFPQPTGGTNVRVQEPGQQLFANETSLQPIVNASCLTTTQTYLIMMLDPEAELTKPLSNQTVPGSNLLHWIFGNLTYDPSLELLATVDPDNVYNDPISALAGCIGPGPAPGITKPVHDYTMLLFDQPDNFTYPANYTEFWNTTGSTARSGFPYEEFIEQSGLGQPIASNWWTELTPPCNGTRETYFGYCPGK